MTMSSMAAAQAVNLAREPKNLAGIRRSRSEPLLLPSPRSSVAVAALSTSKSANVIPLVGPLIHSLFNDQEEIGVGDVSREKRSNWVSRILELRRQWRGRQSTDVAVNEGGDDDENDDLCDVSNEEVGREWEGEEFRQLLGRVGSPEMKVFGQLAFLSNMAYVISEIKEEDLINYCGLNFITSSLQKKYEAAIEARLDNDSTCPPQASSYSTTIAVPDAQQCRPSVVYGIAASAASYVRSKGILPNGVAACPDDTQKNAAAVAAVTNSVYYPGIAAAVATSTVTAVVAAEANARQQAAKDLRSPNSCPCEWFVCDDANTCTRCFVVQGSDSLASWQANLFFEPTKFEDRQVWVHRGIYEAAKGIYEQFMPEIQAHFKRHGERARFRFTGHSLGGSLSLLVSLMLLSRGVVSHSALLPIVTFGSPSVFCGGQRILEELGLDDEFVCSVMMHRDIVPRAFSCNYPHHVAQVLKRLNGTFKSHPCLNNEKLLYSPLGQTYILQPDEQCSPFHPLLPPEAALYVLGVKGNVDGPSKNIVADALRAFLNSPHPLETLSHISAYGSEGTILRDHDSSNYVKAINGLLRMHTKFAVRKSRKRRPRQWWPLLNGSTPEAISANSRRGYHIPNLEQPTLVSNKVTTGA